MKRACLLFALGAFLTNPAFAQPANSTNAPAAAPAPAKPGALTKEESKELNKARANAIKANPDLAAERKEMDDKNRAWSKKVDDAAVKADPNVAAIIAKRDAGKKPMPAAPPKDKSKPTDKMPKASIPSTNAPANSMPE